MSLVQTASAWPQDCLALAGCFPDFPLAEARPNAEIVQQAVGQLPLGQQIEHELADADVPTQGDAT